ncbi:MAG: hypothetical protein ABI723_23430 [Bacteroidia bacterium]
MEKETRKKDTASMVLLGIGIAAGVAIGFAIHYLILGIFAGVVIGIALAWFIRLRGA